jgi:uncharacterized protein (DUF58 family)
MKLSLDYIRSYDNLELLARQLVEGFITGLHKSPYHGFSVEFAEHRLYNTGESTKHIDWKAFAKTDRLYIKQYEEETNLRCQIIIDCSSSMFYPSENHGKITFSLMAAASMCYLLQQQRDAFGVTAFADDIHVQTAIKSTNIHLNEVLVMLQNLITKSEKGQQSSISKILDQVAQKSAKRSLIVIFSDMLNSTDRESVFLALQHLKHKKHEVLLFHVKDQATEVDFDFEDRPYEFIDLENDQKIKVQPSEVKEFYKSGINGFYDQLKIKCGQLKIDFIEVDINQDYNFILQNYLIKRSKMR